uniref:Phospholipase A2 bitanarin (Fragments) n=1 Tax=Bitis arietans TaxID=8692 RepID=PA2B_BITAR|nr:RecName: Full=Phospholipase A2 bitanarin; Short=svPLA2; AltName: Full=Bitis arietans nicotinic acetylcholine receptor inhibitor; AltName: Full=Phosphatidylcholine 2-acylhydrolase [Bitis arietans]
SLIEFGKMITEETNRPVFPYEATIVVCDCGNGNGS